MSEESAEIMVNTGNSKEGKTKSLSGRELPDNWPEVMTLEEHNKIIQKEAGGSTPETWNPIEKLSYRLNSTTGKVLEYEAVTHSNDPQHLQFESLEARYNKLSPTIVLYEAPGESSGIAPNGKEAIKVGGEVAFMQYLAGRDGVESRSLDVTHQEWIEGLRDKGYKDGEIAVYDASRWFHRKAQAAREKGIDLDVAESNLRDNFQDSDVARSLSLVPRLDGKEWTYELIRSEYEMRVGKKLSFKSGDARDSKNEDTLLRRMVEDEDEFRERKMIDRISNALKTHDVVMAVAGSSHPVRQRKALEEFVS